MEASAEGQATARLANFPALVVDSAFLETQILAGRYRLDRQLGKGGMGSVWLAEHLALNSWVAVKLMDPSIASTVEGAERFKREAQAAASLRSAHVVQVLDYGVHENTPFLVMELLQGRSLAGLLEVEKRLTPQRTLTIVTHVARAIGRAHAGGIVHRDLKPDNIFLVQEDDQELAKVLDFGIAKTTGPRFGGMETRTGVTMGTPYYMSPEQVEGKKALDHRSDLWSLAVITCECLTGVRPFDGDTYGELLLNICARPVLPPSRQGFSLPGFDEWFAKGANRDPEQRFGSAQELATALGEVVAGRFVPAPLGASQAGATLPLDSPILPFSDNPSAPAVTAHGATAGGNFGAQLNRAPTRGAPGKRSLILLVVALSAAIVLALGLLAVLLLRQRDAKRTGAPEPDTLAVTPSAAPGPVQLSPDVSSAPTATLSPRTPTAAAATSTPHPVLPNQPAPNETHAAPGPVPATPMPSTTRLPPSAERTARCYSDPFTGQIRLANAKHTSDSFECRQNPFTGAYQRK